MKRLKSTMKSRYALKRTRSAKAPVMSAGVMMANLSWNSANSISGMVGASVRVRLHRPRRGT